MGTPDYAANALTKLYSQKSINIVGVVTVPDKKQGRGRKLQTSMVKQASEKLSLPLLQPASLRSNEVNDQIRSLTPDLVIVVAYGLILPQSMLDIPVHGSLNLHPSLLPEYRGPSPVISAIRNGDHKTGISLMLLDSGMDTGPILKQKIIDISDYDTSETLTYTLFQHGSALLEECLIPWVNGKISATPQSNDQATTSVKIEKSEGRADWNLSAQTLDRLRRAFTPWPGLHTQWSGKTVKLLSTVPIDSPKATITVGTIARIDEIDTPFGIFTSDGILGIQELQLEGKQPVSAHEFLNGYPNVEGAIFH
jgi:methionyl-tRNA formyltransferase